MYKLTLTKKERNAIDWIGYRYSHGDELYHELIMCDHEGEWGDEGDIEFSIPEPEAWLIQELIEQDGLACFSPEFREKLFKFAGEIV